MTTCRAVNKATREACGAKATHLVRFTDGDVANTCEPCAVMLRETARAHGANVKIEKIEKRLT